MPSCLVDPDLTYCELEAALKVQSTVMSITNPKAIISHPFTREWRESNGSRGDLWGTSDTDR